MFEVACFTVDRRVKKNKVSSKRSNTLIEKLMSGKKREGGRQEGRDTEQRKKTKLKKKRQGLHSA